MEPSISIWSSVIIDELKNPRLYNNRVAYQVNKEFSSLEDIRIKIKSAEACIQGRSVEPKIKMEILFLVRGENGNLELITREETVRDRIPLVSFNYRLQNHREARFIIDINKISWEGDLTGRQLNAAYFIEYAILVVKEQVVCLADETIDAERGNLTDILHQLEEERDLVVKEKDELYNKIFFYERNINSLKQGFCKLENRNAALSRELNHYQEQLEQLQKQMFEKERRLIRLENTNHAYPVPNRLGLKDKASLANPRLGWGNRIKSMLMNIF